MARVRRAVVVPEMCGYLKFFQKAGRLLLSFLVLFLTFGLGRVGYGQGVLVLHNGSLPAIRERDDSSSSADFRWMNFCLDGDKGASGLNGLMARGLLTRQQFMECNWSKDNHALIAIGVRISDLLNLTVLPDRIDGRIDVSPRELDISHWTDQTIAFPIKFVVHLNDRSHSAVKASYNVLHKKFFPGIGVFDCSILHESLNRDSLGECFGTFVFYDGRQLKSRSVRSDLRFYCLNPVRKVIKENLPSGRGSTPETFKPNTCDDESSFQKGYLGCCSFFCKCSILCEADAQAICPCHDSLRCDNKDAGRTKTSEAKKKDKWKYVTLTF